MTLTSDALPPSHPVPETSWGHLYDQLPEEVKCSNYPKMGGCSPAAPLGKGLQGEGSREILPVGRTSGCIPGWSFSLKEEMGL